MSGASLATVAGPGVGIAQESDAPLERQVVARQRDVDVVALAVLGVVYRARPLVGSCLLPTLENLQADDRPVAQARVLVALVGLRLAVLVVRLADPHDGAAQSLLGSRTLHDL